MIAGNHLRKGFRFGGVRLVTTDAECGRVWFHGFVGEWVVGVRGERAVAGFAGNLGVLSLTLRFGLFVVAGFAGFMPGERDGPGADIVEGRGAVVSILPESGRDDDFPDGQEGDHKDGSHQDQADEMLRFLEECFHRRLVRSKPPAKPYSAVVN